MRDDHKHITQAELLLALDDELSPRRSAEVQNHLDACDMCRAAMGELKNAAGDFDKAYRDNANAPLHSAASSRAALQAKMAEMRTNRSRFAAWRAFISGSSLPTWTYALGLVVLAVLGYGLLRAPTPTGMPGVSDVRQDPIIPDAHLTPGVVRSVSAIDVCRPGAGEETRPPASVQKAVFHEYGMDGAQAQGYEVDHLITPALGGSDDIRNLWPESYSSTWNAHVKDELEDRLRNMVCGGQLDLTTAQRDIARNWVSAYKKYFHTDRPLSHNSDFVEDDKPPKG